MQTTKAVSARICVVQQIVLFYSRATTLQSNPIEGVDNRYRFVRRLKISKDGEDLERYEADNSDPDIESYFDMHEFCRPSDMTNSRRFGYAYEKAARAQGFHMGYAGDIAVMPPLGGLCSGCSPSHTPIRPREPPPIRRPNSSLGSIRAHTGNVAISIQHCGALLLLRLQRKLYTRANMEHGVWCNAQPITRLGEAVPFRRPFCLKVRRSCSSTGGAARLPSVRDTAKETWEGQPPESSPQRPMPPHHWFDNGQSLYPSVAAGSGMLSQPGQFRVPPYADLKYPLHYPLWLFAAGAGRADLTAGTSESAQKTVLELLHR
ncbi:hypothetical protein O1611_g2089 [Lasiodiplodia mahajangana]|uniref:Uncharacterized protein n=1 Tax=Lasiodiplodia mahajangana TaxID=1108764 RepID=A0ACC2JW20_9PEZI|nr:hypothetical protein O1611_g2089 [Lasiodiplodia mahajangana]